MASFTLPVFLCVAVLSSMTLGAEIGLCQGPCPEDWVYHDGHCYQYVADKMSWLDAELNCQKLGGNLVSEHNQDQHNFFKELSKSHGNRPFWIGLSDVHKEKTWLWSDGTSVADFSRWNLGEPNNAGGHEDCVHSNFGIQKDWNDVGCNAKFPSICALRYE